MKLLRRMLPIAILGLALVAKAEEFDEEIGDDTVQVNEVIDEDDGDDMGLVGDDEEESEVQINTYWPEATITAGKVSEVLISVKVASSAMNRYQFGIIEGGFHFPQDQSYKVQNFSSIKYNRDLGSGQEATFLYPFVAAELAGGRSYGLQINLAYEADSSPPRQLFASVVNQTVEVNENLDNAAAEQFFIFLTFAAFAAIGFFFFASKFSSKKPKAAPVEVGTGGAADASWIPEIHMKKSDTPKTSPQSRRRKVD